MNLELFIARKLHFGSEEKTKNITSPTIRIAIAGIAIGLTVMILAVAIVLGFKQEIRDKVIGFGSHIQISNFDSNSTYETQPISITDSVNLILDRRSDIAEIKRFATKPGVIKTNDDFIAIVFKGVESSKSLDYFAENLIDGEIPVIVDSSYSSKVVISKYISDKLHLNVGDNFISYFINNDVKARKFEVAGVYETNFVEYDKMFVFGDLKHIQRLNGWSNNQFSGVEIVVDDFNDVDEISDELYFELANLKDEEGNTYYVRSIKQLTPQIFSWLDVLDINVWIILILMGIVSAFTMIAGLLVIILERTNMIGILKAMGMNNTSIRKIFLYISFFIIGKAVLIGNIIGISICLFQKYTRFIKLDPENYELDSVPIIINFGYILFLNIGTIILSLLILLGPSYVISKMTPVKSIKFE